MQHGKTVSLLLRIGIAFTFFYAATQTMLHPDDWIWFFPTFLRDLIPHQLLLTGFSLYEILLGILLLTGWQLLYSASLVAVTVLGIILFNLADPDIIFRDVAIFFTAVALATGSYQKTKKKK